VTVNTHIFFFGLTLKLILSLVSQGLGGALQGNFGKYRCAAEIAKTPILL
jgi:hypothetical protein